MNFDWVYKINVDGIGMELFVQVFQNRVFIGFDWIVYFNYVVVRVRGNNYYEDEFYLINFVGIMNMFVVDQLGILGNFMFLVDGMAVFYIYDVSES